MIDSVSAVIGNASASVRAEAARQDSLETARIEGFRSQLLLALISGDSEALDGAVALAESLATYEGAVGPALVEAVEKARQVGEFRGWLLLFVVGVLAVGAVCLLAVWRLSGRAPAPDGAGGPPRAPAPDGQGDGGPKTAESKTAELRAARQKAARQRVAEREAVEWLARRNRRMSQTYAVALYVAAIPAIMVAAMYIEAPMTWVGGALVGGETEYFVEQAYLIALALALGAVGGGIAISFDIARHPPLASDQLPAFMHYFFKPLNGMFLAAVMYVALMAGHLSLYGDEQEPPTIWAVALLALLTGLFSDAAMARLKRVRSSLFPEDAPAPGDQAVALPTNGRARPPATQVARPRPTKPQPTG